MALGRLLRTAFAISAITVSAEEGLWLVNQFPSQAVRDRYGAPVSQEQLERVQLASVRFNSGGSGAFVSAQGLIATNHHVGADCIQKLGTEDRDLIRDGFLAAGLDSELRCPDLEINVLRGIRAVTADVEQGVQDLDDAAALRVRKANIARIEKDCAAATGNRCDVVSLFGGARHDLYEYEKFTDVRLVFAPEFAIAFFGGDPANFTFPRYCLDVAFFRAYHHGSPVSPTAFLPFSRVGAREGDFILVSGHPAATQRLATVAQLEFARDVQLATQLRRYERLISALDQFGARGPEQKRQAADVRFGIANSRKAFQGFRSGLADPDLMSRKRSEEARFRDAFLSDTASKGAPDPWADVAQAIAAARESIFPRYFAYETALTGSSEILWIARTLLRMAEEDKKPDGQRLKEFNDSSRQELEQYLFSTAPIYAELEAVVIEENLRFLSSELGPEDPVVRRLLNGKSPREVALAVTQSTKLLDVEYRKQLARDPAAVEEAAEEAFRLVRAADEAAREYRKRWEDGVSAVLLRTAGPLARARYRADGDRAYPDATFTLRLTYGSIRGYRDAAGKRVRWTTNLGDLFRNAREAEPLKLPDRWRRARPRLNLATPFNFASTADIHGGNSGSPTVNARGEIIGLVFDSNLEALPNRYIYDDSRARSLHVSSQSIVEALRKVYGASALLKELLP
jgi:hypothetical protein